MADIERKKLTIKGLEQIQTFGQDGQKLPFSAEADGKELMYVTYSKRLFSHIKPNTTIEADVETVQRDTKSGTFIDRKITQIYKDGQPIAPQGQRQGGYRKSPEELKQEAEIKQRERRSIEEQVAIKSVTELLIHPEQKLIIPQEAFDSFWRWINTRLGNHTTPPPKTPRFQSPVAEDLTVEQGEAPQHQLSENDRKQMAASIQDKIKALGKTQTGWLTEHGYTPQKWSLFEPRQLDDMLEITAQEYEESNTNKT